MKKEYFNKKKYSVFENKYLYIIFKFTIFGNYKHYKGFNKEYYNCEEDEQMIIISEIDFV